jgi:hypothetical protein
MASFRSILSSSEFLNRLLRSEIQIQTTTDIDPFVEIIYSIRGFKKYIPLADAVETANTPSMNQ